jgi:hypothetical protein
MYWTQTALNIQSILALAVNGNNIFAGAGGFSSPLGVYLSTNNGTNWIQTALNNQYILSLAINGNNIFAGTASYGIFISTNNGLNWIQTGLNNLTVSSLAVSGNNIFAGTSGSGVYLSTNNGTNWTQTTLNNQSISSFAISGNNIFAGSIDSGVYFSTNYGTSWVQKNQGFNNVNPSINSLLISNNYIFGAVYNFFVWKCPLSDFMETKQISEVVPVTYSLEQNYPNPFNPTTNIKYEIPKNSFVKLIVFDALGREIETLVNEKQSAGIYEATFDASNYPSGVYFYRLTTDGFSETKKMILLK